MGLRKILGGSDEPCAWLDGDDPAVARNNATWRRDTALRRLARLDRDRATVAAEIAAEDALLERIEAQLTEGPPTVASHVERCAQLVREAESMAGYAGREAVANATLLALDLIERTASAVKSRPLADVDAELRRLRERVEKVRTHAGLQAA